MLEKAVDRRVIARSRSRKSFDSMCIVQAGSRKRWPRVYSHLDRTESVQVIGREPEPRVVAWAERLAPRDITG